MGISNNATGFHPCPCLYYGNMIITYGSHTFQLINGPIPIGIGPSLDMELSYIPYPAIARWIS